MHDPSRYLTPDVTADFSAIRFEELGPDRVHVFGARGIERSRKLKVSTGFDVGFIAEGQISYAGPGAAARAQLARQILEKRLRCMAPGDLRIDFIGVDSMHGALSELREIAHARTGDQGNILNISLIAYRAEDYPLLEQYVTVERVTQLFSSTLTRPVERYEVPGLGALNFVLHRPANESVTRSLPLDAHGKTLSFVLLNMDIDVKVSGTHT